MRHATIAAAGLLLGLSVLTGPKDAAALECNEKNPDICATCEDLRKAYSGADIKSVRQIRGRSVWTPLYSAYFKDCPELATRYISMGAHPAIGGMEGDMLASVISWDRWEVPKRAEWVVMLVKAGARLDRPPITDRTTRQRLMQEYGQRDDIMALIKIAEDAGG
ncbi:MAG: hypothetical protein R8L07_00365 [Alphaproteobacteria bacterium]|nr:hypothetical protein [Alphaproteobacteria bacterium]